MNTKIDDKIENGYELDLGKIIDTSFDIFKKIVWTAGFAHFLIVLVVGMLAVLGMSFIDESQLEQFKNMSQDPNFLHSNPEIMGYYIGATVLFGVLFSPINAGILNLSHLAKTNQEFSISNIFDYYRSKYLKDIIIGTILISLANIAVTTSLDLLNLKLVGFVLQISISLFTVLFLPLVIYGDLSFATAIKKSVQLVIKSPFTIIGAIIIATVFALLGLIALCIGILFTLPFINIMYYCLYDAIVGFEKEKNVIEEIGTSEEL